MLKFLNSILATFLKLSLLGHLIDLLTQLLLLLQKLQPRRTTQLFIYGESGLGKTHLLHAIGAYAKELYGGVRVRYVSSEEFTNDFINSIRDDKGSVFQRRYRDLDVLLVDDIQFLENKEKTQEEFFPYF